MSKDTGDEDLLGGIFEDDHSKEVIDNMRENAEALGINPDLVASEDVQTKLVAKRGCKQCFGRGTLTVCLSPSKPKVFHKNSSKRGERSRAGKPSAPRSKSILGIAPGNELHKEWYSPAKSEDLDGKKEKRAKAMNKVLGRTRDLSMSATGRHEPAQYKMRNTSQSLCRCVRKISA